MTEAANARVAVYIDFDNIIISRYDQLHGRKKFFDDKIRYINVYSASAETKAKLSTATVDIGAILDYASSFGSIVLSRAYADWSLSVNATYQRQLIERAVDLTQLFPTASTKNGADIRLAVDVVEDLFRLPDITHVVIVAGDSDYIALAQRSKRLGRYVVGIGVAGSTSTSLAAACDEFADYDALPGLDSNADADVSVPDPIAVLEPAAVPTSAAPVSAKAKAAAKTSAGKSSVPEITAGLVKTETGAAQKQAASRLMVRAMQLISSKDDADWLLSTTVKNQMLRMDPAFSEKALGYKTFTDFLKSRGGTVELEEDGLIRRIRLRQSATPQ